MGGICLVGLSGSMIKDAVKETQPPLGSLLPQSIDVVEQTEPTKILLGIFFVLFAQIL